MTVNHSIRSALRPSSKHPLGVLALAGALFAVPACFGQAVAPILSPAPAQAPPPPAPAPTPATVVESSKYIIGADDVLQISVWKEPQLTETVPVRPDGMISIPLLGDVRAAGFTPMQLSNMLSEQLKKYVQEPVVNIVVTSVNSQRVFMVGEVGHVGPIPITPGMTPLQAIATAGGLTPYAKSRHIYILRGPQGSQQKIFFNYKEAVKGDNKQNITLLPGDTVVVP